MTVNAVSEPIRSIGGYYISGPARAPGTAGHQDRHGHGGGHHRPTACLPLSRLLLPLGASPTKDNGGSRQQDRRQCPRRLQRLRHASKVPEQIKGAVYMNLGNMQVGDLSPEIQKALATTHSGEMAPALHLGRRRRNDRALRQEDRGADRLCDADAPGRRKSCCSTSRFPPWRGAICATSGAASMSKSANHAPSNSHHHGGAVGHRARDRARRIRSSWAAGSATIP